ncbi:MAG TPA: hypothetical protein VEV41_21645 [Terriglobales bacterium]|nr:hypothetical protein [Terriglobales bacterium]
MEKSVKDAQQKRSCAYCGGTELTREHLIPQGYFDRTGRAAEFVANIKAGAADKIVSVEPTISDVCRNCNNDILSRLDSYFLVLFDRYFTNIVVSGKQIRVEFNFDELLRWLLKMGYNMGRARQWDGIQNLAGCKDYIRLGEPRPSNITVLVQAVTPGTPGGTELDTALASGFIAINAMRVPRIVKNFAFVLQVGIQCYQFYVLLHHPETNGSERRMRVKAFQRVFRGTYEVCPSRPIMKIYPSSITLWGLLSGPLWNAGWAQHLRHYFGKRGTNGKPK